MATNDYYSSKPTGSTSSPPPGGYYGSSSYNGQSSSATPSSNPPPYASQQHLTTGASTLSRGYTDRSVTASPFESVFDDHVYPAPSSRQSPSSSTRQLSQQDTAYHPLERVPSEEMAYNHTTDDIPLQNQSASRLSAKDAEMQDHVYDAPQRPKKRTGAVRFGELGMFGANAKRIPWVVYLFTVVQVAVFIGEIVKNATETGSPIQTQPSFNPMIGPSSYILINMGARFVPCMHNVAAVQGSTEKISWPCPNSTTSDSNDASMHCTLSELCGFGGVQEPDYNGNLNQSPEPNQWFRFIVPMFLHAGLVHIGFNLLLQLTMGREMEKAIGSIRFFLVYVCSGIFGFVLGGNFAATGISSTGASGALFGVIALTFLDLLYSWKDRRSPVKDLMFILLDVIISFVLGLLPGLDNFSHIGGFLMGLALGICVLHSPNALRRRIGEDAPYSRVNHGYLDREGDRSFFKNPVAFFKDRKPLWWAWWILRAGALVLVLVFFILLLNNFYVNHVTCSWCKYLSCLPVNNWCDIGNLQLSSTSTSTNTTKRELFSTLHQVATALHIE